MRKDFIFTSESVTEGHPDKLCDQISDAIVDHFLRQDPYSRILTECAVSSAIVFIAARFASDASVDLSHVARRVIQQVGYEQHDFNARTCSILTAPIELASEERFRFREHELSDEEIEDIPAKNQVTEFGFACDQTAVLMPLPIWLAHKLARQLSLARRNHTLPYLLPDGKVQVSVQYREGRPGRIHTVTVTASQTRDQAPDLKRLHGDIVEAVIRPAFEDEQVKPDGQTTIFVNPDGPFFVGGPSHHSGLTGRKNAIDTYGEYSRHSGKALSGKDPVRIDRVGAYAARYAAKNVVAAGLAKECEIAVSYAIGRARPVSVEVQTFGTGRLSEAEISALVTRHFDFRLAGILKTFNLRHLPASAPGGFYQRLASYGQLGRADLHLPWESTDKVRLLSPG
ncbi:MAG TPA: methionine adenosyltransferase [Syntrophobacteria bacterium]|nr:methionine adenosyltransferase [Syntrophobacteria bacterium]